jgi:glutaredoxin
VLDRIRTTLHGIIDNPRGDAITGVRVPKMFARKMNDFLGNPLCSAEDLVKRRAALAKLENLRGTAAPVTLKREPAPVVVYFEKDRNQRLIERVQELLGTRSIAYRALDVTGDEATMAFVMREAKCEEDDLPIVFVAGVSVGGYNDLVEWDVSGKLKTSVFGD